jgi:hypothetical protein
VGSLLSVVFALALVHMAGAAHRLAGKLTLLAGSVVMALALAEGTFTIGAAQAAVLVHTQTGLVSFDLTNIFIQLTGADVSWLVERSGRSKYGTVPRLYLEGADLRWAHVAGADLEEAHLEGAIISEAYLEGAHLSRAYLQGGQPARVLIRQQDAPQRDDPRRCHSAG